MQTRLDAANKEVFKDMLLDAAVWEADTKRLQDLVTEYFHIFEIHQLPEDIVENAAFANGVSSEDLTEILRKPLPTIEEEIQEIEGFRKTTREEFIKKYKPTEDFPNNAMMKLSEEKRKLLIDHYEIFLLM